MFLSFDCSIVVIINSTGPCEVSQLVNPQCLPKASPNDIYFVTAQQWEHCDFEVSLHVHGLHTTEPKLQQVVKTT